MLLFLDRNKGLFFLSGWLGWAIQEIIELVSNLLQLIERDSNLLQLIEKDSVIDEDV